MAQSCEDYGTRVQKSVFECQVGQTEWLRRRDRLLREIKETEDSLRFYFLDVLTSSPVLIGATPPKLGAGGLMPKSVIFNAVEPATLSWPLGGLSIVTGMVILLVTPETSKPLVLL